MQVQNFFTPLVHSQSKEAVGVNTRKAQYPPPPRISWLLEKHFLPNFINLTTITLHFALVPWSVVEDVTFSRMISQTNILKNGLSSWHRHFFVSRMDTVYFLLFFFDQAYKFWKTSREIVYVLNFSKITG